MGNVNSAEFKTPQPAMPAQPAPEAPQTPQGKPEGAPAEQANMLDGLKAADPNAAKKEEGEKKPNAMEKAQGIGSKRAASQTDTAASDQAAANAAGESSGDELQAASGIMGGIAAAVCWIPVVGQIAAAILGVASGVTGLIGGQEKQSAEQRKATMLADQAKQKELSKGQQRPDILAAAGTARQEQVSAASQMALDAQQQMIG